MLETGPKNLSDAFNKESENKEVSIEGHKNAGNKNTSGCESQGDQGGDGSGNQNKQGTNNKDGTGENSDNEMDKSKNNSEDTMDDYNRGNEMKQNPEEASKIGTRKDNKQSNDTDQVQGKHMRDDNKNEDDNSPTKKAKTADETAKQKDDKGNEFAIILEKLMVEGAVDSYFSAMKDMLNKKKSSPQKKRQGGDTIKTILVGAIKEVGHRKSHVLQWWDNNKEKVNQSESIDGGNKEDVAQKIANTIINHWEMDGEKQVE